MDRMNTHSTNNDELFRSESRTAATTSSPSHFALQWGSRKRLRCMKVHAKDHNISKDPTGSRTVRRSTARIDRGVVRSDANNKASKDPIPNRQNIGNSIRSGSSHLNLRPRPASPSRRILRNSESSIGMKGCGNGVRDLAAADRKVSSINTNCNNNNHYDSKSNNINNHHNNHENHLVGGGGGAGSNMGGSPETIAAVWPPKFVIALTNKEKEEDFMAIKGSKLPQRPKKRAKFIQRTLNLVSPGAWLCDLTLERYEVREKKVSKKRAGGLKAMGNDSDSE